MRHDWNSLITDVDDEQAPPRFSSYSRLMFPLRHELVTYLNDFASKSRLKVVYNTDVTNITRIIDDGSSSSIDKARFTMIDQRQQVHRCRYLPLLDHELIFVVLVGATALQPDPENLRLRRFKSDRDEIWQECF